MNITRNEDAVEIELPAALGVTSADPSNPEGLTIFNKEGPIRIQSGETVLLITAEGVEIESTDISLTAEGAVEIEAGADFDLTVGGAVEIETTDISVTAAAVEVEAALFTVE